MKEFDLNSIWNQADKKADSWYQELRPELEAMARQKNDGVLQRIRRLVEMEMIFSVLLIIGMGIYGRAMEPLILALVLVTLIGVLFISYRYHQTFRNQIEAVPTMNIKASTKAHLQHLTNYRQRLVRLSMVFLPFGLGIGFVAGFAMGTDNDLGKISTLDFWLKNIPFLLIATVLCYFFVHWYYRFFIGSQEDELKAVLARLDAEE